MALKFLDLDPVKQPVGRVRLHGVEHDVWPLKVGTVINLSLPAAPEDNGSGLGSQLDQTIGIVQQLIPTVTRDALCELTLEQLNTLLAWARDATYGGAEKNSETPTEPPPTLAASTPSTSPA
jgi:hypothetical protein